MVSYPYPYTEIGVSWSLLPSANARKSISAHSMNRRKYTNSCRAWEMWNGFQLHLPKSSLKQYMFTFRGGLSFRGLSFRVFNFDLKGHDFRKRATNIRQGAISCMCQALFTSLGIVMGISFVLYVTVASPLLFCFIQFFLLQAF